MEVDLLEVILDQYSSEVAVVMRALKAHHAPERVLDSPGRMSHIVDRAETGGLRDSDQESEDV